MSRKCRTQMSVGTGMICNGSFVIQILEENVPTSARPCILCQIKQIFFFQGAIKSRDKCQNPSLCVTLVDSQNTKENNVKESHLPSQYLPTYDSWQTHLKSQISSTQVPPFWHTTPLQGFDTAKRYNDISVQTSQSSLSLEDFSCGGNEI